MNDRTQHDVTDATPDQAIDTGVDHPLEPLPLTARRPDWMPAEDWNTLMRGARQFVDQEVAELKEIYRASGARELERARLAADGCRDRSWCTMRDADEHAAYHAGDLIALADAKTDAEALPTAGYWCWPTEDRDARPKIVIEANGVGSFTVDAAHVLVVLEATRTPEGREALAAVVEAIAQAAS